MQVHRGTIGGAAVASNQQQQPQIKRKHVILLTKSMIMIFISPLPLL